MWQVSVIHNAQANSFSFRLYSVGCQGSRTAGRKLQWLSLLPCNSIRKASMKSIFIEPGQNCTAQWNDNEKIHKGDRLNDKFLKRCCSGWPSIRLANTHGHMGLRPQGFTLIPCHLYPGQTADCESKGISWYTVLGHPIQLFCISEGKEDVFLKHPGPRGTHTICWITGNSRFKWHGAVTPKHSGEVGPAGHGPEKSWENFQHFVEAWEEKNYTLALSEESSTWSLPAWELGGNICALNWSVLGKCWTQFCRSLSERSPTEEGLYMISFILLLALCWWQGNM